MPYQTGDTLKNVLASKLTKDNACQIVNLYVKFMQQWASSLFIRSGIGHGDPHSGNVLVDTSDGVSKMIILDWGNILRISPVVQRQIRNYVIGILMRDAPLIVESLGGPSISEQQKSQSLRATSNSIAQWISLREQIERLFNVTTVMLKL